MAFLRNSLFPAAKAVRDKADGVFEKASDYVADTLVSLIDKTADYVASTKAGHFAIKVADTARLASHMTKTEVHPRIPHMSGDFSVSGAIVGKGKELFASDGAGIERLMDEALRDMKEKKEHWRSFFCGPIECVVTDDYRIVQEIDDAHEEREGDPVLTLFAGKDILTAEDYPSDGWKFKREIVKMAVGHGKEGAGKYAKGVQEVAMPYIQKMQEVKTVYEMHNLANHYILDAISHALIGVGSIDKKDDPLKTRTKIVIELIEKMPAYLANAKNLLMNKTIGAIPQLVRCGIKTGMEAKKAETHVIIENVFKENRETIEKSDSLFMRLIKAKKAAEEEKGDAGQPEKYDYGSYATQEEAIFLIGAGYGTTADLIKFAMLALAARPDIYKELREENERLEAKEYFTIDDFSKMKKLDAFLEEVLKWYDPFPIAKHTLIKDVTLKNGVVLEKGTVVLYDLTDMLQTKNGIYGSDADEFRLRHEDKLESKDKDKLGRDRRRLFFGEGPRSCPGQHLAKLEVKAFIAQALKAGLKFEMDKRLTGKFPHLPLRKIFSLSLDHRENGGVDYSYSVKQTEPALQMQMKG